MSHCILSRTSICTHLSCSIFPQVYPLYIQSRPILHFAHWLHFLSLNQGHYSSNSAFYFLWCKVLSLLVFSSSTQTCCYVSSPKNGPSLDLISPSSFHPTSLLPFVTKLLERIVNTHCLLFFSFVSLPNSVQSDLAPIIPPKVFVEATNGLHVAKPQRSTLSPHLP